MESAFQLFINVMATIGFVGGVSAWVILPILLFVRRKPLLEAEYETDVETVPYSERQDRRMAHRYIGLSKEDPRSPEFAAWAAQEYDAMFGQPYTADQIYEKNRTILGWAFLGLNWFVHPPVGQPQLTAVEAGWFYRQLESSFWRVPGTRHEEPAS